MDHLFLDDRFRRKRAFTSHAGGGGKTPVPRTREQHAARLFREYQRVCAQNPGATPEGPIAVVAQPDWVRVSFAIRRGHEECIDSLAPAKSGIRIRAVTPGSGELANVIIVTVFIPKAKLPTFIKKLTEYETIDSLSMVIDAANADRLKERVRSASDFKRAKTQVVSGGITKFYVQIPTAKMAEFIALAGNLIDPRRIESKPSQSPFITSIEAILTHVLEHCCPLGHAPTDMLAWAEVWLACEGEGDESQRQAMVEERFRALAQTQQLRVAAGRLRFPDRVVVLAEINRQRAQTLLATSADVAEFRPAESIAGFIYRESNRDQAAWVEDLRRRVQWPRGTAPAVCVVDTGVNRAHPLLEPVLAPNDQHSLFRNPDGSPDVNDHEGHGTEMAGIATFGELEPVLMSRDAVAIKHRLESVKLIPPPPGRNQPNLWGDVTDQAVARVEGGSADAAQRSRVFAMAVTSALPADATHAGKPTSWSAAIDQITYGHRDDQRRLFIISAGNTNGADFPLRNLASSIESPGQSWNALTVGAYTARVGFDATLFPGHTLVANEGDLCPFSTTATEWDTKWPNKPDVVFEGGNLLLDPQGRTVEADDLKLLTTWRKPSDKPFSILNGTSSATAQAGHFAAQIMASYPQAWPETVRALTVHSAEWKEPMRQRFLNRDGRRDYARLLRTVGYGVPNLGKAIACGQNSLTLITQQRIRPYKKEKSRGKSNEMHLHELPWPRDELLRLGDQPVTLRVTLSYFVDPSPEGRAWIQRYRYPSHALRFDVKKPGQSTLDFVQSINAEVMADEEGLGETTGTRGREDRWLIGTQARHRGSIHSDILQGITAADVAGMHVLAVYPVTGWMRERYNAGRIDDDVRYSLIVSIETPSVATDLYTPVLNQIRVPVATTIGA
jgi:hypothetical protein